MKLSHEVSVPVHLLADSATHTKNISLIFIEESFYPEKGGTLGCQLAILQREFEHILEIDLLCSSKRQDQLCF
jgi:hypothetical protein